ncbi:hypothetical protein RUM44_012482 [Polyplax serrata]|uniref:Uncharacterized protein n=1 Tax=Polyplax serrata TaxID=468196 RepID=A0ABR1BBF6_POLSC
MKAGLEGSRRGGGPESQCRGTDTRSSVIQHSGSRLKPPPNSSTSTVISTATRDSPKKSVDLDRIVINDRTKSKSNETKGSSSPSRVVLKRPSGSTSSETSSPTENKKQRVAIKWP